MEAIYKQIEEAYYDNNEYENMPSACRLGTELTKKNIHTVDFGKVGDICGKYGFKHVVIERTFGGDMCSVLIYIDTDLPEDPRPIIKEWRIGSEWYTKMTPTFKKLHDCIHELDEHTPLLFKVGWHGNVGCFGSSDLNRLSYSYGDTLWTWESIIDWWSPDIHDTNKKLKKGSYVIIESRFIK